MFSRVLGKKGSKGASKKESDADTNGSPAVGSQQERLTKYNQRSSHLSSQPNGSEPANGASSGLLDPSPETSAEKYKSTVEEQVNGLDLGTKSARKSVPLDHEANAPQLPPVGGNGHNGFDAGLNGSAETPANGHANGRSKEDFSNFPRNMNSGPAAAAASQAQHKTARKVEVTAEQRHYLIKALVALQMSIESRELEKVGGLTQYGHPFSLERPKLTRLKKDLINEYTSGGDMEDGADDPYADVDDDVVRRAENLQEPVIFRHLFHVNLHPFPGLDTAPLKYWQERIQIYFDEMAARNFSTSLERGELSKRRFFGLVFVRYLSVFFARGVGVRADEGELRGPGPGEPGSEKWGPGKQWGKGTVKRGLDKPIRVDDKLMQQIDELFEGEDGEQWKTAGKEAHRIRSNWQAFKEHVIEHEDGIEDVQRHLDINNLKNLPAHYRNAEEFARVHAAGIFHSLFVTSPGADGAFAVLKGIHLLFPYFGAKQLLHYANAQLMIKGILSLLLARPAGAKSLIQRVFSFVIGKEANAIEKNFIKPIRKAIEKPELAKIIEEYVKRGNRAEKNVLKSKTLKSGNDILTVILLEGNHEKPSAQVQEQILEMQRCYGLSAYRSNLDEAYPQGTPVAAERKRPGNSGLSGAESHKATQFALLKLLLRESLKKRDREQAVAMASGSLIPTIIKDSLENVFYQPIKTIASTANLSARLGDLQAFIDDMIAVKKAGDNSYQAWVALAARHENSLYYLFHECNAIAQPFMDWLQIGADFMALSTSDPNNPSNRSKKNVEVNVEHMLADDRLTDEDVRRILREIDQLTQWTLWQKVSKEIELRKNFILARPDAAPASGLGAEHASPEFQRAVEDTDSMMTRLMQQNGVKINDGLCHSEARGTEAGVFPSFWFDILDPCGQHLMAEKSVSDLKYKPLNVSAVPPTLLHTRKLLPVFQESLLAKMPDWHGRKSTRGQDPRRDSVGGSSAAKDTNKDARSVSSKKFKLPFA